MNNIISKSLLTKEHVHVYVTMDDDTIHVDLSKEIKNELSKWPRKRRNDLFHDIKTSVIWAGRYRFNTLITRQRIYDAVICTLNQTY